MAGLRIAVRLHGWSGPALGACLGAALLAGCSSSSGGGGLSAYEGATTAADITVANSTAVASSTLKAGTFNDPALAQWAKPGGEDAAAGDLLARFVRRPLHARLATRGKAGDTVARGKVTIACGGPSDGSYTVDDRTNSNGVGTVVYEFFDCNFGDGVVINGKDTDRTTSDTSSGAGSQWVGHDKVDVMLASGGADYAFQFKADYDLDQVALADTYTGTYEFWNMTSGGGFRLEDAVSTYTFPDATEWDNDCADTADVSGRIYDGVLGFVDAMTTASLVWTTTDCDNAGPSSGGPFVLTGDAGDSIELTPQSDTDVQMAVDEDADTVSDSTTTVTYVSLGLT